jgi:hypothetical protein
MAIERWNISRRLYPNVNAENLPFLRRFLLSRERMMAKLVGSVVLVRAGENRITIATLPWAIRPCGPYPIPFGLNNPPDTDSYARWARHLYPPPPLGSRRDHLPAGRHVGTVCWAHESTFGRPPRVHHGTAARDSPHKVWDKLIRNWNAWNRLLNLKRNGSEGTSAPRGALDLQCLRSLCPVPIAVLGVQSRFDFVQLWRLLRSVMVKV